MTVAKAKPAAKRPKTSKRERWFIRGTMLDVKAVIDHFGTPKILASLLKQEGLAEVEPVAIYRWGYRNKIPGEHLVALMVLARRMNVRFNPLNYWTGKL
jgi:hypothetical protein